VTADRGAAIKRLARERDEARAALAQAERERDAARAELQGMRERIRDLVERMRTAHSGGVGWADGMERAAFGIAADEIEDAMADEIEAARAEVERLRDTQTEAGVLRVQNAVIDNLRAEVKRSQQEVEELQTELADAMSTVDFRGHQYEESCQTLQRALREFVGAFETLHREVHSGVFDACNHPTCAVAYRALREVE
jgi:DNA repair exonuclease SbcCD ATPase subunit